ncbi:uncharacterized protein [Halyomorpha halys]|uniref:uncharacterized protein n=1 Tax=Halyomorpha halys TaxID=286706 RepID=UPI0006D51BE2|nr:uncharacterized protein LOC106690188 [Halyomorpha halys]KAE8573647.1 EcKinase 32 [Halyomorpha halys]
MNFNRVISDIIDEGYFGNVTYIDLQPDKDVNISAQFASSLRFFSLTVKEKEKKEVFSIVVKLPCIDPTPREARNCNVMFDNEVNMYKDILPSLGVDKKMYPKMFYGISNSSTNPNRDLLILENMKSQNYVPSSHKIFLDFDHISLVIKKLAAFHSLSYIFKNRDRNGFYRIKDKLKEVVLPTSVQNRLEVIHFATMERGIKPLLPLYDNLKKVLKLLQSPYKIRKMISYPEEPYPVICHGDFCNNNILYKYDGSGIPVDCAFLDFQLSQYSSPAIDLFFFLYMHTTSSFRERYWDVVLEMYWINLKNSLPSDVMIPGFDDYMKHFGKRALYGYMICSWFLPSIMDHHPVTKSDYADLSLEEKVARFVTIAGEEGEKVICEVVSHLLSKNYIDDLIEFYEEKYKLD